MEEIVEYQPLLEGAYSTRGKINPETQALLSDWTGDSDEDQIAETYREGKGKLLIDYKTVAQCCLLNYYKDNRDLNPQFIQIRQEFLDFIKSISKYVVTNGEYDSDIDDSEQGVDPGEMLVISKDLLRKTFINATELFDTVLHLVPKATRMGMTQDIVLYSGIRTYKGIIGCDLFHRSEGDTFVLPTFTATSVSKNTAYRFAKADPEAGENMRANKKRIMRIVIPAENLGSFPFCYLSKHVGTIKKYITNKQEAWSGELEILLAPGMKLELVSVELDVSTVYFHPRGDRASSSSEEQTASGSGSGSEEGDSDKPVEPREHTSFTEEQITVDIYTLKFVDVPTDAEIGEFKSDMESTFELLEPFLEEEAAPEAAEEGGAALEAAAQGNEKKPKTDGGRRKRKSRKRKSRKRKSRKRKSRKRKSRKRKSRKRKSRKRFRKGKSRKTRKKR